MSRLRRITDEGLDTLIQEDGWFAVAFMSRFAIPCDHFLPELAAMPDMMEHRIGFHLIDIDENPTITDTLGITAVPTSLVFLDGKEMARYEGPYSREALKERLAQLLPPKKA